MSYVDKGVIQANLLSESGTTLRDAMATVNKSKLEQDILKDHGNLFQPFLCTYEQRIETEGKITPDDQNLLEQLYTLVQGSKGEAKRGLKKLQKLKAKYPSMPMIHNFISAAYQTLGQEKKNYHTIKMTYKNFPNYIFGKISLADHRIVHGHHEEVPEIFDQKLQLYMHYTDTGEIPTFHGSEVQAFYTVIGRYYARNRQIACAIKCYFLVEEANRNSPHLDVLAQDILVAEAALLMMNGLEKMDNG